MPTTQSPAKKRARRAILVDSDAIVEQEVETTREEREEEREAEINEWLGDFQAKFTDQPVKILVEKFEDGEWSICRKYPLGTFEHESVRDEFGGGRYRATLFDNHGKYIKDGRNYFKFAAPVAPKPVETKAANPLENPIVLMMLKSHEENAKNMLQLTQAMITANSSKSTGTLPELIEAMHKMQNMAPKSEKPMESFKDALGIMKLVKEVSGDSDKEDKGGLLSELKDFLELWPTAKDALANLKPQTLPAPAALPVSTAPVPAPGGPDPMQDPLTQKLVSIIPNFVNAAKSSAPIEDWADYLLDTLETEFMPILLPRLKKQYGPLIKDEDDVFDLIVRYAKDPAYRASMYEQVKPLAPYKPWCDLVIDKAIALTEEETPVKVIDHGPDPDTPTNGHSPAA